MQDRSNWFFDSHMHLLTGAHPNLSAVLDRAVPQWARVLFGAGCVGLGPLLVPLVPLAMRPLSRFADRLRNILAVMDNDVGNQLLRIEECLLHPDNPLVVNGVLRIGSVDYSRIVLTPLLIDFGYKITKESGVHYTPPAHNAPSKPIVSQVRDYFFGVQSYYARSKSRLFTICPFMGINPALYSSVAQVQEVLEHYFAPGTHRPLDASEGLGEVTFDGNVDNLPRGVFAGVKVYPPAGFDPWPADRTAREKQAALYRFCSERSIGIISHCAPGGFVSGSNKDALCRAHPARWIPVLEQFGGLRLCLAHFLRDESWAKVVVEKILPCSNDIFVDIAFDAHEAGYYARLASWLKRYPMLNERVLFGTDFSPVLLKLDSYSRYLHLLRSSEHLSPQQKHQFCNVNPLRWLFGQQSFKPARSE